MSAAPPPFGGGVLIADKSAWEKARLPSIRVDWSRAFQGGQIVTCGIVELELLYSARDEADFASIEADLAGLRRIPIGRTEFAAAITAMRELSARQPRYHRVSLPDALIAAAAQERGCGVLHYDQHYDRLTEVMNFDNQWIAPRGTL